MRESSRLATLFDIAFLLIMATSAQAKAQTVAPPILFESQSAGDAGRRYSHLRHHLWYWIDHRPVTFFEAWQKKSGWRGFAAL
jgi:hypothetical protein